MPHKLLTCDNLKGKIDIINISIKKLHVICDFDLFSSKLNLMCFF